MHKKEFTSFDVAATVRELKTETGILNSRVSNVYQLNPKTLLFKLHKPDRADIRLVSEAGRRLHLTAYAIETPSVPPAFCMALRKYLRNGWLIDVEQYEFERFVVFTFKTKTGILRLVLELFGDGNIILANEKGIILQALIYKRMRDRNILRGEAFVFAPPSGKNPFKISREELVEGLKNLGDVEVVRAIARFLGLGGTYAEEILLRTEIDKTSSCNTLNEGQIGSIFEKLQNMLSQVSNGKLEPCIVLDESGAFIDVTPLKLKRYENFKHQLYSSFNEALDEFYVKVTAIERAIASVEVDQLKREAERLKRVIAEQEKMLAEAEGKAEHDKRIGDVIYAHSNQLQVLLDTFLTGKKAGKNWNTIVSEVLNEKKAGVMPSIFFESFDPKGWGLYVCVDDLRFSLDVHASLFENAALFYERGKRSKQKLAGAKTASEDSRKKLQEIEAKLNEIEAIERAKPAEAVEELAKRKIQRKEWYEKFRWFTSSEGFLVVAGKDAVSNEILIKKHTMPNDIVFHADIAGAPFVVVKAEGKTPTEQVLRESAEFAVAFSRGWREGFGSADVYWVKPEQLSKSAPSGEYVAHGAFVVSGKRNWFRNIPLRTAIGLSAEESGEKIKFVGGPVDAVKAKADALVIIVPGDQSGKELLKHIQVILAAKLPKELREKILKTSIEEIREHIPYNKGRIPKEPK